MRVEMKTPKMKTPMIDELAKVLRECVNDLE